MTEKTKWGVGCFALVALFVVGVALLAGLGALSYFNKGSSPAVLAQDRIAVVNINDVIYSSDKVVEKIVQLESDNSVKAMVLHINSPGGGVAPSQEIYEAVWHFKSTGKKVVASLGSIAASGGYYIACAADTIMANPGTLTGSIGVIFEFPYAADLMKKIGVDLEVVKSGKYKDAGSFARRLTSEERALFQGVIDDTWDQFIGAVAEGRGMDKKEVKAIADGRVFTGRQALSAGLIDTLGTFEDAKSLAKAMVNLPEDAEAFEFGKKPRLMEWLIGDPEELFGLRNRLLPGGLSFLFTK